jgi:hypothetical protein
LNANVIADGKGSWWVASQVNIPRADVGSRLLIVMLRDQAPTPSTFNTYFTAMLKKSATRRHDLLFPPKNPGKIGSSTTDSSAIVVQLTGWIDGRIPKADNYL